MAFVKFILNGWENEIVPSCSEPHGQGRQQTVQSLDTLTVSHDLSATHFSVHVDSIQQCFECFLCVLYVPTLILPLTCNEKSTRSCSVHIVFEILWYTDQASF